jgi:hypothetical protein
VHAIAADRVHLALGSYFFKIAFRRISEGDAGDKHNSTGEVGEEPHVSFLKL